MNELEMSNLLWFNVEIGIQRRRETRMSEWICHLRSNLHEEGPEDIFFTNTQKYFCEMSPRILEELHDCFSLWARPHSDNRSHATGRPKLGNGSKGVLGL